VILPGSPGSPCAQQLYSWETSSVPSAETVLKGLQRVWVSVRTSAPSQYFWFLAPEYIRGSLLFDILPSAFLLSPTVSSTYPTLHCHLSFALSQRHRLSLCNSLPGFLLSPCCAFFKLHPHVNLCVPSLCQSLKLLHLFRTLLPCPYQSFWYLCLNSLLS